VLNQLWKSTDQVYNAATAKFFWHTRWSKRDSESANQTSYAISNHFHNNTVSDWIIF
jgi:hypothetical protein